MHGSVLVVGRVSGQIVGLAGNRHNVYGAGICDKPQWLFDVGFYFWYKGYISSVSLCRSPNFMVCCSHHFSEDIYLASFTINTKSNKSVNLH